MNPGDRITIHMHDTKDGFRVDMTDQTTHQQGSMTASIKNGFGHILYEPDFGHVPRWRRMRSIPSTTPRTPAGTRGRPTPTTSPMSDEIGHFENCLTLNEDFNCAVSAGDEAGGTPDGDDNFCVPATNSMVVKINGCFDSDSDFDGPVVSERLAGDEPERQAGRHVSIRRPCSSPAR